MALEWGLIRRPPCQRRRSQRLGPFEAVAQVASGRRTEAVLARHVELDGPWLLRVVRPDQDRRAIAKELDYAAAFDGAARAEGAAEYDGLLVTHARPVVGETLATILGHLFETRTTLSAELAVAIVIGVAARIRDPSRVHGDLVPHHILVGYDGYVHAIDPCPPEALADRGQAQGRAGYRSPEHIAGHKLVPSSDVFSLGVLLFELTTGHRLFEGDDAVRAGREILSGEYKRPRSVVESYPIELQVALRRMLRPAPGDRFPDAEAASEALRRTAEKARTAGPALGRWLSETFAERREAWQVALRAAGFDLPSVPPRAPTATPAATPAEAVRPAVGAVLTLEELERADQDGRALFDAPPMDFEGPGTSEITAPSAIELSSEQATRVDVRAVAQRIAMVPEAAPRSDTLLDPAPPAAILAHAPSPASVPPPRARPSAAPGGPPRPVPKLSRPPAQPRAKAPMDLTSDLLEDFGAAPLTDRGPAPGSLPPEPVAPEDLELEIDLREEPGTEVAIPLPRRLQRSPSVGPDAAPATPVARVSLDPRTVAERTDTALDPPRGARRSAPARPEATMVVRDRGPRGRPSPGQDDTAAAGAQPPPTPRPSSLPPPPEPLPELHSRPTAPRRHSSIGPLPKRPAEERRSASTQPPPPERRPPKDPTSEMEQLVIPVVEEETPARKRRALVFVVLGLLVIGVLSGAAVAHLFPEWLPPAVRAQLTVLERIRPAHPPTPPPEGTIPPTTITPPPVEPTAGGSEDLPPLEPLIPPPAPPDPVGGAGVVAVRVLAFPARTRILVDGERVNNGGTVPLGPTPRVIELRARGCTPYRGTLDPSTGESFEMVLPCKSLSRPSETP